MEPPRPTDAFLKMFDTLKKTDTVVERLVKIGYGSNEDGQFALVECLQKMLDDALTTIRAATDDGATPLEAAVCLADKAEKAGADSESTFVVYVVYTNSGIWVYIGETMFSSKYRWRQHPRSCEILTAAIDMTPNGKDDWTCRPLIVLPEEYRNKALLLYFEEKLQRALQTVGTRYGLNARYGSGLFGGACDVEAWKTKYAAYIEFLHDHGRPPAQRSADDIERSLACWAGNQRMNRASLQTEYVEALEALRCWKWRIVASPTSATQKIDALLVDPLVIESGGMLIPSERAEWVKTLRAAYDGRGGCVMTTEDKRCVEERLPGVVLSSKEARFRYNVIKFAEEYLKDGVLTYPNNGDLYYNWMKHVQNEYIVLSKERCEFMIKKGIGALIETLKPEDVRAETRLAVKRTSDKHHTIRDDQRRAEKAAKADDIRREVAAGPVG